MVIAFILVNGLSQAGRVLHGIILGGTTAPGAEVCMRTEQVLLPRELFEGGIGRVHCGNTLNKHPFIGGTVFPRGRRFHVFEFALAQCLADLAPGGFLVFGFHDKIRKAGDVVGIGTDEFGHDSPGLKVDSNTGFPATAKGDRADIWVHAGSGTVLQDR